MRFMTDVELPEPEENAPVPMEIPEVEPETTETVTDEPQVPSSKPNTVEIGYIKDPAG